MLKNNSLKLFLAGAAILYLELALIRWLGSSIRIVAYYSNFILIAAFLGLGAGAILNRRKTKFQKFIFPILVLCIAVGPWLGKVINLNPKTADEFIWMGAPAGIPPMVLIENSNIALSYWFVLLVTFLPVVLLFAALGGWLAELFQRFKPLRAYSIEVGGSLFGIILFALLSYAQTTPLFWFLIGFGLLILALEMKPRDYLIAATGILLAVFVLIPATRGFAWSPYYKIKIVPLEQIYDLKNKNIANISENKTYALTVNNDYHQLTLDLSPRTKEHDFFKSWRWLYDLPYKKTTAPGGPILIVGAGTGNDVSAALRNTKSADIYAVEIDPTIIKLGKQYHPENPYADPRVKIINNDARSFFTQTDQKYSKVVFGFLDSHTLMSHFSSLRLDNFVYTKESLEQVKNILLPGGEIYLTFATNETWIHQRLMNLLNSVFDFPTTFESDRASLFANGIVYKNAKAATGEQIAPKIEPASTSVKVPTDNWPFLYLRKATIPRHYLVFMALVVSLGTGSLLLLRKKERKIKLTYFFMGAAFFLIETANVTSLSLLYGSTWIVNVAVFMAILFLILLGNLICQSISRPRYGLIFIFLLTNVLISYFIRPSMLLGIESKFIQGILSGLVFLGPVFFASLIFGSLIKNETSLPRAYGSNLLGAAVGGSLEYFSLVLGIKELLLITFAFYVATLICFKISTKN